MMAANGGTEEGAVQVVPEEDSFLDRQKKRLKEIEKKLEEDARKKKREWEKGVERMKREFLKLYPADKALDGEEINDPYVARRRGSIDILDTRKMKTLFSDNPYTGYKFKLRFDVRDYELETMKVWMEGDVICVKVMKKEGDDEDEEPVLKEYFRKVEKPSEVDCEKIRCCLTKDKILIVESSLPPHTLNFQRSTSNKFSGSPSHSFPSPAPSSHSSNSPHTPSSAISMALNKPGVPVFGGPPNERRMNLVVDIGKYFHPKEITCQVLTNNRIQIRAKHEEKTTERFAKHKFNKEWELTEKIEAYSIRAGLTEDGKLIVGALGKEHDMVKAGPQGQELWDELSSETTPCNVLDLASFPPTTPTT